jgi:formylmethanofuran dehydrogenase subunit B
MWQNCSMKAAATNLNAITATCPACGLLCDDIQIENSNNKIKVLSAGNKKRCEKAVLFFEQPLDDATPLINGKPATMQQAIAHAAKLIKTSQKPLFAGLSTDVAGFRSIYNLAQKTNGNLQHMNAQSSASNLKVLQSTGWQTTTLTEVKNRADVIVCFGDISKYHPRFFERFVDCDGMFVKAIQREVIFIGEKDVKNNALQPNIHAACRADDLPEITMVLRALVAGKTLKATEVAGVKISDLQKVADKLKAAKYAVLAWVAKDLDFPHAELTIQNITETVAILNQTTRAAGLPLGGSDGDTTANNANTWLSGLTLNDEHIEHDLMVWINSFGANKLPPETDKPLIVIGNAPPLPNPLPQGARGLSVATEDGIEVLQQDSAKYKANNLNPNTTTNPPPLPLRERAGERGQAAKTPDIFIPIATPGLDCSGTLFRVDSSVILPLKKVRENDLPTLSEVISQIEALL